MTSEPETPDRRIDPASLPDEHRAAAIARAITGHQIKELKRFPTGLTHAVFDVTTSDQHTFVLRVTCPSQAASFRGAIYWHTLLRPRGVPLPDLIYADPIGTAFGYPVMLMERLPGTDLGAIYPTLTRQEKYRLASRLVAIQERVRSLPLGSGFGYAQSYDDPSLHHSWLDVLLAHQQRSRQRLRQSGVGSEEIVDRVSDALFSYRGYFDSIEPRCFLDDTTTKNVIVSHGSLSGLVDVDTVCFGDVVQVVGLTQMALLSSGYDTDYIDAWTEALHVTAQQRKAVTLYTAMYCVDFISEMGQSFNKDIPEPVDDQVRDYLLRILDCLLLRA